MPRRPLDRRSGGERERRRAPGPLGGRVAGILARDCEAAARDCVRRSALDCQLHGLHAGAHHPTNVLLANQLYAVGRVAQAISHFNDALRIDPEHADAHRDLDVALRSR
jgi:hypothetical protein